ncbi:hypothetical protein Q5X61_10605 [Acinetobacter baumannii]|nr:hypothetical protein [Acinetobacter baumannii]
MKTDIDKISESIKATQQQLGLAAEAAAKRFKAASLAINKALAEPHKKFGLAKISEKK